MADIRKRIGIMGGTFDESLEEKMKSIMGTRVQIHRKKNDKGKIEIEYYSKDELERIIDLFESIG